MRTYTFRVSLPDEDGGAWRQVELPADFTLEDLHLAIQDAYAFDNSHLYSFFMSGEAWDTATEYALPDDAAPWDLFEDMEEDVEGEDADEPGEAEAEAVGADDLLVSEEGAEIPEPTPAELGEMLQALKDNPELLAEAKKQVTEQLGIPGFLFDMVINNADQVVDMMGDPAALAGIPLPDGFISMGPPTGDVRDTTLDGLELKKGQSFLYLFDYGDEWRFNVQVADVNEDASTDVAYPRLVESAGEAPDQYGDWDEDDEEFEDEDEV